MTGTIIITGASSGIGRATAERFLEGGWNVGLLARRAEPLEDLAGRHPNAVAVPCDVTSEDAVEAAFATVVARTGRVDALFNNAGRGLPAQTIDEMSLADWQSVVDLNLTGMFLCARAAFRQMRRQDPQGGRIVNNGSLSAYVPRAKSVAYTATKYGVGGLTRTLALDGRPFDIACGQIDIGNAATDMTKRMEGGTIQSDGSMKVEPRMDVRHVADSVWHMVSLPLETNVLFMTVMASKMPYVGRG